MSFKDRFLTLLADSTIVQGLLTVLIVGAWLYMLITGAVTPDKLDQAVMLVIGFYFGAKVQNLVHKSGGSSQ